MQEPAAAGTDKRGLAPLGEMQVAADFMHSFPQRLFSTLVDPLGVGKCFSMTWGQADIQLQLSLLRNEPCEQKQTLRDVNRLSLPSINHSRKCDNTTNPF